MSPNDPSSSASSGASTSVPRKAWAPRSTVTWPVSSVVSVAPRTVMSCPATAQISPSTSIASPSTARYTPVPAADVTVTSGCWTPGVPTIPAKE